MADIGTGKIKTYTVPLTVQTSAYADGDVIAVPTEIPEILGPFSQSVILQSCQLFDAGDQGVALDVVFLNAEGSVGAINAAFSPNDTVAATITGRVAIVSADYLDCVGSQFATPQFNPIVLHGVNNASSSLWVTLVSRATPTYQAVGDLTLHLGVLR